jgi:TM2 domain-containing membrane protein YozV
MTPINIRCPYCGLEQPDTYVICANPECQKDRPLRTMYVPTHDTIATRSLGAEKKIPAGICGILLGSLGIHKFILGYTQEGIIMLAVTVVLSLVSCGSLALVPFVFGIIEGIIYLTKSDAEFVKTYVENKRGWF